MSVFGSLFTGVSALNAQSQSLTIISNNIANNQTPGFKRAVATFANLVTGTNTNSILQPGGVRAASIGTVNQQGLLQSTGRKEDMGILGEGMFVVGANVNNSIQFPYYTRAGRFEETEDGYLQTPSEIGSHVLYGWRLDEDGNIPTNFDNLSSLEPVNLNFLPGFNNPTTTVDPAINFDSSTPVDTDLSTGGSAFSRIITVYDSLGNEQLLTMDVTKVAPPNLENAVFDQIGLTLDTELNPSGTPTTAAQDLTINLGGVATVVSLPAGITNLTVGELIDRINAALPDSPAAGAGSASLSEDGAIVVIPVNEGEAVGAISTAAAATLFTAVDSGLAAGGGFAGAVTAASVLPSPPNPPNNTVSGNGTFPALGTDTANANPFGWWQVTLSAGDQVGTNASVGYINFNADGSINATANANGNLAISLNGINYNNGSDPGNFDFQIDRLTQLNSSFLTTDIDQNGSSFGVRRDYSIDENGVVNVLFSNDEIVPLYQIAIADFPNYNGLNSESLNVYTSSNESGEVSFREANTNGSGQIYSGSFEQSNVDLADEFSRLIITQRAYSAGTKVINTADQMLAELLNIR